MRPALLACVVALCAACSRSTREAASDSSDAAPATRTEPAMPEPGSPGQPGALMVGTWDISGAGVRSPSISVTVDSARGSTFFGRIVRAFSGDMGLDPAVFRPFAGTVSADSVARFEAALTSPAAPAVVMAGRVTGDTWALSTFIWGGMEQVTPDHAWTGRRAR